MSTKSTANLPKAINVELGEVFKDRFISHRPISQFTPVQLGGPAEYLVLAETIKELMTAASLATQHKVPFTVLGGASGILASDVGYPGLIIINQTSRILYDATNSQVVVDSGVINDRLLNSAAAKGLGGLEFLAAVPGTVGGAVATNAGWQGKSMNSVIKEVVLFVPGQNGQVVTIRGEEITTQPYQRMFLDSVIQSPVILTVRLQFSQTDPSEILRRLLLIRRARQKLLAGMRLGQVFTHGMAEINLDRAASSAFKKFGAAIEGQTETILRTKERLTAGQLRQIIKEISRLAEEGGVKLEERLHYLGYWPDGEAEIQLPHSSDTESL